MDQIYPFVTRTQIADVEEEPAYETIYTINPRTGRKGILELHPIDGTVYLFRGSLSQEECAAAIQANPLGCQLVANEYTPAFIEIEQIMEEFTLYSEGASKVGYVRIVECDCK